ncbi:acyltransferase [Patulibacter sp. NPDC049589]|uniref:acyltransferase family protein n=1 Tax=Patulibacter sp. NPDC049589 TaxID=3154731 RepID=UPI00343A426A
MSATETPDQATTAGAETPAPPQTPERPAWRRPWYGGDGARGLGALLVFCAHVATAEQSYLAAHWTDLPGRDLYGLFGGEVGWRTVFAPARLVNLFFAFSAYLLARPFIAWALGRTTRPGTIKFYVRRVLRIMPAFWAVCGLLVLWLVVLKGADTDLVASLKTALLLDGGLAHAGFQHSWTVPLAPAWTVRVEVLGYLMLPFVAWGWFWATRRWGFRGLTGGMLVLLVIAMIFRFATVQTDDGPGVLQWLFLPGLTVAVVEAYDPLREWIARRGRGITLWALLASFLILCGSEPASASLITHLVDNLHIPADASVEEHFREAGNALRWGNALGVPMQFVGATGMLLCFVALEWQGGRPPLGLDRKIPRWFGERSYSFYLVHFAVLGGLLPHVLPSQKGYIGLIALGVCAFAVSLALTVVLFRFVEMPGMLLASRLTGRRPPGPLAVSQPVATQAWRAEIQRTEAGSAKDDGGTAAGVAGPDAAVGAGADGGPDSERPGDAGSTPPSG